LPDVQFVLDDWWLFQKFARTPGRWDMARALLENRVWGSFRTNSLSFVGVYGLWGLGGARPGFYYVIGVGLQALIGYLLYRVVERLGLGRGTAWAAGALFVVLPTAHNPVFWFPSCAPYFFSAVGVLVYLWSAAGEWSRRAGALQAVAVGLAFLTGDQAFGLLAGSALWMAVVWRSRGPLRSALVAWGTMAVVGALYLGLVNKVPAGGSMAAKFDFRLERAAENVAAMWGDGYYGWTWWGLGVGVMVWWLLRGETASPPARAALLGVGWWVLGVGPVLFLRWRELRYDYLPGLGLAVALAALCRRPVITAVLVGWSAGTVVGEIQQCWRPMARNTQAVVRALQKLENVRDHDIVAVAGTPGRIGTAPHFAMYLSYSSTPFVETVAGVFGLHVGRAILWDSGRLGLEHVDFFRELKEEDLRRAHVVACDALEDCSVRTVLAREVAPGRYEMHPLKNYRGSGDKAYFTK
jgi:hypothetical protein